MADEFSFLTDSDDDRAVEDVLSQAIDHSVLEQIAAINCSSFSSDNLPSHLETRFRKLKSLPTTAGSRSPPSKSKSRSDDDSNADERQIPDRKTGFESPPKSKSNKTPKSEPEKKGSKSSDSWSLSSPELSPESRTPSPPPARRIGCLWWSPKKEKSVSRKTGKENRLSSSLSFGDDIEILSKTFSMKEQKKIMKKAMKKEEKINREAEKIVKWAKQASARMMDVSGLDDELSDFDNTK